MDSVSVLKAAKLAQQRGLSPKDFAGYDPTMPNRWNNQALADALGMNIMSTGSRNQRVLAAPTATQAAPTMESLLNKYSALGATDFNMLDKPTTYLTPKGKADYVTNQPLRAAELQASSAGMNITPEQINTAYGSGYAGAVNDYNDWLRWKAQDDSRGGLTGFLDKATPIVTKAGFAYIGGGALANSLGNALVPGSTPTVTAPVMIPGTEIPLSTAVNVGKTAYRVAKADDPGQALTNAAFRFGAGNSALPSRVMDLAVVQNLGKRYGIKIPAPAFDANVKTPDIAPVKFAEGGEVRPTPEKRPAIGALARALQAVDEFARKPFGYDNPPVQIASDLLSVPQLYRTMENFAYGSPLASGTSSVSRYLPRLNEDTKGAIEASLNLMPLAGPALKASKAAARAAAPYAAQQAVKMVEKYGVAPTMNVVKPKSGNWLAGHVEHALDPLKRDNRPILSGDIINQAAGRDLFLEYRNAYNQDPTVGLHDWMRKTHPDIYNQIQSPENAINRWIDTKLDKYIRNEMATPEDPVRALAERGVLHVDPTDLNYRLEEYGIHPNPGQEFMATSDAAKMWEGASDNAINVLKASDLTRPQTADIVEKNPWLAKLSPETNVYATMEADMMGRDLGFDHLIDELKNAMSPTSELPRNLRIDPKDIDKITVPQAVERVAKINAWRAEQAAKAEREGLMVNLQATPRLADEGLQLSFVEKPGGAWVDIPETVDPKGMQLCTSIGKAGGWCTQGETLAKSYGSGNNRLATLLDSEGRPHAQAKITTEADEASAFDAVIDRLNPAQDAAWEAHFGPRNRPPEFDEATDWLEQNAPDLYKEYRTLLADQGKNSLPDITELKPPGNSFSSERSKEYIKRDPEYKNKVTQSVLKFLNSGEWGRVSDLHHYDIVDLQRDPVVLLSYLRHIVGKDADKAKDLFNAAIDANPDLPRFVTPRQLRELVESVMPKGMAAGGLVSYDPDEISQLAEQTLNGYAEGGKKKPSPFDELEPTFGDRIGAAISDKLTEGGMWLYDKLADRDKLSSAHKIYLDTFVHDKRDPITAKDFSSADLAELQNLIAQKEKLTGGKGAGYIQYKDYDTLPGGNQKKAVDANLMGGVLPPRPSLSKALGQFNYKLDPKTGQYKIIDEYDFNPQQVKHGNEMVDVPPEFYGDYLDSAGLSLYKLARLYGGRKMPPGKGRKVELSVPGFAEGGEVSADAASAYDPNEIDTIVSQLREDFHA